MFFHPQGMLNDKIVRRICLVVLGFTFGSGVSSDSALFGSYENAFDSSTLHQVVSESHVISRLLEQSSNHYLAHGKKPTFWFGRNDSPSNAIERAIIHLLSVNNEHINPIKKVIGAEWWIQRKSVNEGIGFHYDKDEGLASTQAQMRHPLRATVTYLSDHGAATVVMNMTTADGNSDEPAIPTQLYVSFPKKNRHITFRFVSHLYLMCSRLPI